MGILKIETPLIKAGVLFEYNGFEEEVCDNSGVVPRYLKLFRLPKINPHQSMQVERSISLQPQGDNPIFVRVTLEDGTLCWTSPIYLYR